MANKVHPILKNSVAKLNDAQLNDLLSYYAKTHHLSLPQLQQRVNIIQLQEELIHDNINTSCPYCGCQTIKKYNKRNEIQRFKCQACNKIFSVFTNTFLDGPRTVE